MHTSRQIHQPWPVGTCISTTFWCWEVVGIHTSGLQVVVQLDHTPPSMKLGMQDTLPAVSIATCTLLIHWCGSFKFLQLWTSKRKNIVDIWYCCMTVDNTTVISNLTVISKSIWSPTTISLWLGRTAKVVPCKQVQR